MHSEVGFQSEFSGFQKLPNILSLLLTSREDCLNTYISQYGIEIIGSSSNKYVIISRFITKYYSG